MTLFDQIAFNLILKNDVSINDKKFTQEHEKHKI